MLHTFILHFRPIENYPPIQNLLTVLSEQGSKFICVSTNGDLSPKFNIKDVKIIRPGRVSNGKFRLWVTYLSFNITSLFLLIYCRPKSILYYESSSAMPVYIYKRFFNKKVKVHIHYHEYTSIKEYEKSSFYERICHKREKYLYKTADWISHTNETRLSKFLKDENLILNSRQHKFLPNYPLSNWGIKNTVRRENEPLKLIYVGYALDEKSSFISELVFWLSNSSLQVILDVYLVKEDSLPSKLLGIHGSVKVQIFDSIAYQKIPQILSKYHVGVILYRAPTDNYRFNAPNKLFEYLQCGLDVWYPDTMQGIFEYDSFVKPKVIRLDMNNLSSLDVRKLLVSKQGKETQFSFEETYLPLKKKLFQL